LINNFTASALNSGVNFLRVEPITILLLVDNHSTSVTFYESDRPPASPNLPVARKIEVYALPASASTCPGITRAFFTVRCTHAVRRRSCVTF
jgi:hypothetical protein